MVPPPLPTLPSDSDLDINGQGKHFGSGIGSDGGGDSLNNLDKKLLLLQTQKIKSVLREDLSLLLSNPTQGPASALAPPPTLPYEAPVLNSDLVPPQTTTTGISPPLTHFGCSGPFGRPVGSLNPDTCGPPA